MRTSVVLMGLAAIATPDLLSQKPTTSGVEAADLDIALDNAWQAFQQNVGGTWVIERHAATGTPKAIYGTGLALQGWRESSEQQARVHADAALVRFRDLLGLGASDFRVEIAGKMGSTWVLVYDQSFRGVPVIDGRADVRIHESGAISLLGSMAWPIPATFSTVPVISAENAERIGLQKILAEMPAKAQPARQGSRLVIWGDIEANDRAPFFLAWEVRVSAVDAEGNGPIGRVYIDALTGHALHYRNDKHECGNPACSLPRHGDHGPELIGPPAPPLDISGTVTAWTRTALGATEPLVNIPLAGLEVSIPGVGTAITDATGTFSIPSSLTAPVSVTVNLNGIHMQLVRPQTGTGPTSTQSLTPGVPGSFQLLTSAATSPEAAHTSTYYWVHQVNEFCRGILGNTTQLATADNVLPTVNIASTCNAYYTGNTINFYAAGGNCNNTAISSVIAHEWGHGLDDRYGGITNNNGDGLSEAWGDVCGMYLVDDFIVGRGFTTAGGFIRTGMNTRQWTSLTSSTAVHASGEVFMGFCWKLRDRLRTTMGTGPGTALAETIVIGSIIADASNQTTAVREIFIADDNDANLLNGTPHYNDLVYACGLHSMPYPAIVVGSIAHTPLGSTTEQLTPRVVNCFVTPISGSFTVVRLHYDDGTGAQNRPMMDNGVPYGYRALLPGVMAPGNVTYHFEAVHSTGPTVRLPLSGEYTTVTGGPETRVYFDNFDTGAPGWTHGMVAINDDWQIGTPVGRSGTSQNVTWADPAAAYSGPNCAGNDHVAGTGTLFNGSYSASAQNWLRAPVLNTTGQFGLKLRFRRWLTIEEGQYDQAQILVNNVVVWQNQAIGHHRDTSWVLAEVPIPQADNNPAVTIEWRLIADAGMQLGGWTIDDVEVVAVGPLAPLDAELRITPAQVSIGAPMNMNVVIRPTTPFLLGLGDTAGPTLIPGIPPVQVGGSYIAIPAWTDAAGNFNYAFTAPASPAAVNTFWYSQVLTLDPAFNFVTSNAWINLFQN